MTLSQQAPSLVEQLPTASDVILGRLKAAEVALTRHGGDYPPSREERVTMAQTAQLAAARITDLEDRLHDKVDEVDVARQVIGLTEERAERAEADVAALTKALTGLTCGGSEFFVRRGDSFVADVDACVAWVRRSKADAHRRTVDAIKARKRAEAQCRVLSEALTKIEAWFGEFPEPGITWPDGSPMSYGAAFGSNGERDYMRSVARQALSLSGGGEPVQKKHELEPAANHPGNPDSSSQSQPYPRSHDDQQGGAV